MLLWRYLLVALGIGIFGSAVALTAYDVYLSAQLGRLVRRAGMDKNGALRGAGRPGTARVAHPRLVVPNGIR